MRIGSRVTDSGIGLWTDYLVSGLCLNRECLPIVGGSDTEMRQEEKGRGNSLLYLQEAWTGERKLQS